MPERLVKLAHACSFVWHQPSSVLPYGIGSGPGGGATPQISGEQGGSGGV
jgi:hypothetical protein